MKQVLFPVKVISEKGTKNGDSLIVKKSLQIGLTEKQVTEFDEGSYVILDFGKEICGGIRIFAFMANNVSVRIRFGESLTECCAELSGEKNATNDHSLRDFTVNLQNYSDMTFGGSGFRFVRLDFYGKASLKSVVAESRILNKKPIYLYDGKDKKIKDIFTVAKRTIDLCASGDYLWDGVKRDRLVWIGDIHPEMLALTTLYGRVKIVERSLDFVKEQTPLPNWMNWFPTYSMWWIINVADYCEYAHAEDFAKKQMEYMAGLIDLLLEYVSESGDMNYPSVFVDWQTSGKKDEKDGARAINIIAAKKAIALFKKFSKKTENAEELLRRLMKKEINVESSKSVLGLKYFAVGLTESDKQKLVENGANGVSTFMSYYILKAIASFDKEKAIEMLKEYYGAMLDKGATSFWEDFDMKWIENSCRTDEFPKDGENDIHGDYGAYCYKGFRHSLCHGWSSGIIRFIKEYC
ncbi:MAG: hypothetical protein J5911_05655 [Clostridia bacterium]|nr:hypothetical protein [Clostridia bacterium]